MNITITKHNNSIQLDGSFDDLILILTHMLNDNIAAVQVNPTEKIVKPEIVKPQVKTAKPVNNFDSAVVNNFLNSIYTYAANVNTSTGKARAIAEMLCDGRSHSISATAAACNSVVKTVSRNINLMVHNGATISVDGDIVTVNAIPTARRARRRQAPRIKRVQQVTPQPAATSPESILNGIALG